MSAPVVRAAQVTCQYTDAHGMPQIVTARGFLARALLHETDHLSGILYVDHERRGQACDGEEAPEARQEERWQPLTALGRGGRSA